MADIFDIQEEISREISAALRLKLTREDRERFGRRDTDDEQAYQAYLKGRYCWNQRTIAGMQRASQHFREAIDRDPAYAVAYTGLGDALAMLSIYHALAPADGFPKALTCARRALDIDPHAAEAHATLGFSLLYHGWDLDAAVRSLKRAIELKPGYASAHQWHGFCLGLTGQFDRAIQEMTLARELDPFSASINTTGAWPFYWSGRMDDAFQQLKAAADLHPGFWGAHYWLGLVDAQRGHLDRAATALERACELSDTFWVWDGLACVYAWQARLAEAEGILSRFESPSSTGYVSPYSPAMVRCAMGDRDGAFAQLDAARADRSWRMMWLHVDPVFASLRNDSRFAGLLARIRAEPPDQWW